MTDPPRTQRLAAVAALIPLLLSCDDAGPLDRSSTTAATTAGVRTSGLQAGGVAPHEARPNPYEGDARAVAEGRQYYIWMNCHSCHGERGGGGIGPPFADAVWIYGSAPENIYQSIVRGRPNGMPAYGGAIPEDRVWMIAAYVRSLGPPDPREEQPESPTRLPESPPANVSPDNGSADDGASDNDAPGDGVPHDEASDNDSTANDAPGNGVPQGRAADNDSSTDGVHGPEVLS